MATKPTYEGLEQRVKELEKKPGKASGQRKSFATARENGKTRSMLCRTGSA